MVISQFEIELQSALQQLDYVVSIYLYQISENSIQGKVTLRKSYTLEVRFTEFEQEFNFTLSFTLLYNDERIWGLDKDNRIGWHIHPIGNPKDHEPIQPKSISEIISIFDSMCSQFMSY